MSDQTPKPRERRYKVQNVTDVDWSKTPVVEGRITEIGSFQDGDRKAPYIVVQTADRRVRVYASYDLKETFNQAAPGDGIRVEFLEEVPIGGGKTVKKYSVSLWSE